MYTKDPDVLTEYVRQALSRQITLQYTEPGQPLRVLTAGAGLEKAISERIEQSEQGSYLAMDPETSQRIYQTYVGRSEQDDQLWPAADHSFVAGYSHVLAPAARSDDAGCSRFVLQRAGTTC